MPAPSSIGPIRPGYIERGVLYARKAAYADGYRVGRAGGPVPHRRDVYPYAKRWITGYIDGDLDRREYDHGVTEGTDAGAGLTDDGPRGAAHPGPLGCVLGLGGRGGSGDPAAVSDHGSGSVGQLGGERSRSACPVEITSREKVA